MPPQELDAAIFFASVGDLAALALEYARYPPQQAILALADVRRGRFERAAVLVS
jgi:hypothetical protein